MLISSRLYGLIPLYFLFTLVIAVSTDIKFDPFKDIFYLISGAVIAFGLYLSGPG